MAKIGLGASDRFDAVIAADDLEQVGKINNAISHLNEEQRIIAEIARSPDGTAFGIRLRNPDANDQYQALKEGVERLAGITLEQVQPFYNGIAA